MAPITKYGRLAVANVLVGLVGKKKKKAHATIILSEAIFCSALLILRCLDNHDPDDPIDDQNHNDCEVL